MSLYRKYRPSTFEEMQGNDEIIASLKTSAENKGVHAYLLHGPSGCGKTTLGRILAKELGALGSDYHEIDSADFRGIDTIRDLRRKVQYNPLESDVSVYLLDECHKLSNDAQNALLKLLEDPPQHVYIILATTDPQKIIPTIKGRCKQYAVRPLNERYITRLLRKIVKQEGATIEKDLYAQIAQDSLGHPRNAIQILEQALDVEPEQRSEVARRQAEQASEVLELCRVLLTKTPWKKVANILQGLKENEPEAIRRQVLGYMQAVLLTKDNPQAGLVMEEFMEPMWNTGFPGLVFACYSVMKG